MAQESRPEELKGAAREVALSLKSWYRERAKVWWQNSLLENAICDDRNEPLNYGEGYLRPGGYLSCERCTDRFFSYVKLPEALNDIDTWFGPGVPPHIKELARKLTKNKKA
jgi:hypothetical protein